MKFVASTSVNVREKPDIHSNKVLTLYRGNFVDQVFEFAFDKDGGEWARIDRGWVYATSLNDYVHESDPVVRIPEPLRTLGTAEQYILWEGAVKYNLCGEFCTAYLGKDDIHWFLSKWRTASPQNYTVAVIQDKPTGIATLKSMLDVYKLEYVDATTPLTDKYLGFFYSPERFKNILDTGYKFLCGVKIGHNGKLNSGSIGHWVVLESVEPLRDGDGLVTIYNPHPNRKQKYSYTEFIKSLTSFGGFAGVWVKPNE